MTIPLHHRVIESADELTSRSILRDSRQYSEMCMTENSSTVEGRTNIGRSYVQIFRANASVTLKQADCMTYEEFPPGVEENIARLIDAADCDLGDTRRLFSCPGFSLVYAWFKSEYPVPRHSHNGGCLVYIVAGSLRLGTEHLCRGDGFFLPAGEPFTYEPGKNGLEILEFRTSETYSLKWMSQEQGFWDTAVARVRKNRDKWKTELPPSGLPTPSPAFEKWIYGVAVPYDDNCDW